MTQTPNDPYEPTQFGGQNPSQSWQNEPSQPQPAASWQNDPAQAHPGGPGPQTGPHTGPQPGPFGQQGPVDQYGQPLPVDQYGQPLQVDQFGQPLPGGPMGPPPFGPPPGPGFFAQLPTPIKLALASGVAGLISFFMGFVSWVSFDESIENDAADWAADQGDSVGIPAFLTMVFTPGVFLLLLGAAGVAAFGFVAAKWRKYLPHMTFLVILAWLGLLASALGLPSFIGLGAGAFVSLIFGAFQLALIGAATVMDGMNDEQ
ncbi:DUF5336 domain-containing protein [Gordonia sp. VNK21]|uniref:DUF5336 domain-containing protein n=1 Tax=Gordonia sp. VNK21 TaxID=3382483 RepID=UPI0038D487A9